MRTRLAGVARLARHNPRWRRYYLARWISVTGSTIAPLAVAFAVLELGGGATGIGVVLVTGPLIFMAVSPFGGVIADRWPRRRVLAWCQFLNGTVQAGVAVLVLTHTASVPTLAGLELLAGATGACFKPAVQGLLPELVDKEALPDANSFAQVSNNMAAIVGPTLAGFAISSLGPGWVLGWDAVTFYLSGLLFTTVRVAAAPRRPRARFTTEMAEGWRAFLEFRWVAVIALLGATSSGLWAAGIDVLGPVYAAQHLGGPVAWGIIGSALGAGFAVGSITTMLLRPRRAGVLCCAAMLPEALLLGSMAYGLPLAAIATAAAICGAGGTMELVTYQSLLQARLPEAVMSRVLALIGLVGTVFVPVAYGAVGPLTAAFGAPAVLWGCSIIAILAAIAAYSIGEVRQLTTDLEPTPALTTTQG